MLAGSIEGEAKPFAPELPNPDAILSPTEFEEGMLKGLAEVVLPRFTLVAAPNPVIVLSVPLSSMPGGLICAGIANGLEFEKGATVGCEGVPNALEAGMAPNTSCEVVGALANGFEVRLNIVCEGAPNVFGICEEIEDSNGFGAKEL